MALARLSAGASRCAGRWWPAPDWDTDADADADADAGGLDLGCRSADHDSSGISEMEHESDGDGGRDMDAKMTSHTLPPRLPRQRDPGAACSLRR